MRIVFAKLSEARLRLGHTAATACEALGVSPSAWWVWQRKARKGDGSVAVHPLTERAISRYVGRAGGKDDRWDVERIRRIGKELMEGNDEKAGE